MESHYMQNEQAQSSTTLEIIEKLHNFPVNETAKTVNPLFNVTLVFAFLILANIALLINVDGFSSSLFDVSEKVQWWNYVLAFLSLIGAAFFMIKAFSFPLTIALELKSDSLKNVLKVAKYNPNVKSYIRGKEQLNYRDYHYLNIDEQLTIISNLEGVNILKQALLTKKETISVRLEQELKNIQVAPFIPQTIIMEKVKKFRIAGLICLGLVVALVFAANLINMQFTPVHRAIMLLVCVAIILVMVFFFSKSSALKNNDTTPVEAEDYQAVKKLCLYSEPCREYVAAMLQEGRVLNERDLNALSVYAQLEKIKYTNMIHQEEIK